MLNILANKIEEKHLNPHLLRRLKGAETNQTIINNTTETVTNYISDNDASLVLIEKFISQLLFYKTLFQNRLSIENVARVSVPTNNFNDLLNTTQKLVYSQIDVAGDLVYNNKFYAQRAGHYIVNAKLELGNKDYVEIFSFTLKLLKNGTVYCILQRWMTQSQMLQTLLTKLVSVQGSDTVFCEIGDYLELEYEIVTNASVLDFTYKDSYFNIIEKAQ